MNGNRNDASCGAGQTMRVEAALQRVGEVMVKRPKALSAEATVGEVRVLFENPRAANALLVDGSAFVGVLTREDIPATAADAAPARPYARRDVYTVRPGQPVTDAEAILDTHGLSRLVVLEDDGATLAGLLCLDRRRAGFCRG